MSDKTFAATDITRFANEKMQTSLVPDILSNRQDFFLKFKTVSVTGLVNHYQLPERAIGNAIYDLWYLDQNSNFIRRLPRINPLEQGYSAATSNEPYGFFFMGDQIVISPTPTSTANGKIKIWYFSRPSELVATSSCSKITAVSTVSGTTTFTVNTDLTATLASASTVDILNGQSPFVTLAEDVAITAITSTTIAFTATDIQDESGAVTPGIGDYICPPRQACIPMVPQEFHPILSQMVVCRMLEALGDVQKLQAAQIELAEMRKQAFTLIANRSELSTSAVVTRNGIFNYIHGTGLRAGLPVKN